MRRNVWLMLRRVSSTLAVLAVLLAATAPVAASRPTDGPGKNGPGRTKANSPFNLNSSNIYLLALNAWQCGLQQIGEVCTSAVGSSVGGGGFWPNGTANQYIFNSGLQVAAVIGEDGGAAANDTVATFFFNASATGAGAPTPFLTPVPSAPTLPNEAGGFIYASNRPEDLAAWPEDCYLDNSVFGHVKTLSELDTCVQYWDGDPTASHFPDSHPMGLLVTQHGLLWSFPSNKDIMFFIYKFKNVSNTPEFQTRNPGTPAGGWTLTNVYSAFAMDPDVSGGEYSENFATVVPDLNIGAAWQYDFEAADFVPYAPNFDAAVGFVGVKFLKSPVNTDDTARVVRVGNDVRTVQPGEELGLTFFSIFTNGGIMSDAGNGHQAFRYLSGNLLPLEKSQWCPSSPPGMCYVNLAGPDDMRFYQSSGPFTLAPGEEAEIVVAYVAGAPVPGTYTKGTVIPIGDVTDTTRAIEKTMGRGYDRPGFPSLFANALTAQAIFDADFVLPSSPATPAVTVIPGDKQNTILWDSSPLTKTDPYCQLAGDPTSALFDPNFRCNDFEGFRVYRKSNPSANWTPIAQFDLANGIVENVVTLEEVETADGSTIVVKADTARVCPSGTKEQLGLASDFAGCVGDSGLSFAIIDRGGSMPDPSNGPGLINGVRYYYAVTSFDINSPQSGPSSLESGKILSTQASGVPRPNSPTITASSATVQLTGAGGEALDASATTPAYDTDSGTFTAPIPASNGLVVDAGLVPELLTEPSTVTVTVDSIIPGAPQVGLGHQFFVTVTNPDGTKSQNVVPIVTNYTGNGTETASFGLDATKTKVVGSVTLKIPDSYYTGNMSRGIVNLGAIPGWPRWFVSGGSEVSDPSAGQMAAWCDANFGDENFPLDDPDNGAYNCAAIGKPLAGELPGVTEIATMASYSTMSSVGRGFDGVLGGVWRAADIEVTWGDNGSVTVMDLSNKVPVPFHPGIRSSYGFLTPASFADVDAGNTADGDNSVITFSDYSCLDPMNQYAMNGYVDFAGNNCQSPVPAQLQQNAQLVTVNWAGPLYSSAGNWAGTASPQTGISMFISGQIYHFITSALPAPGTKWTLRSYTGTWTGDQVVTAGEVTDYTNYVFHTGVRPPVTGLTATINIEPAVVAEVTDADLESVHTVPDPYYVTNTLENTSVTKRLQFVNLPSEAVVRIYSLSGILIAVLNQNDPTGGGTLEWDLRTRNNQFVASGVYFYHVEAPNGKTKVGKFTVVQYAQ